MRHSGRDMRVEGHRNVDVAQGASSHSANSCRSLAVTHMLDYSVAPPGGNTYVTPEPSRTQSTEPRRRRSSRLPLAAAWEQLSALRLPKLTARF